MGTEVTKQIGRGSGITGRRGEGRKDEKRTRETKIRGMRGGKGEIERTGGERSGEVAF